MTSAMTAWGDTPEDRAAYAAQVAAIGEATQDLSPAQMFATLAEAVKVVQREEEGMTPEDHLEKDAKAEAYKLHVRELGRQKFMAHQTGLGEGGITLLSDADLLSRPVPEWWVDGLIQQSTIAVLAGEAGIGKSFLMLHIARCVASGMPFFGHKTKPGKVLYVVAEGASAFGARVAAWNHRFASAYVPPGAVQYVESGVNLSDDASVKLLQGKVLETESDLIILDTLSQLAAIDNENDAAQLAAVFRTAKRIRDVRPGATVIIVHHVNKVGGKVRGSSVIRSNADTVIIARASGNGFDLTTDTQHDGKQKDGTPLTLRGFHLEDYLNSAVLAKDNAPETDTEWQGALALLRDGQKHASAAVKAATGAKDRTASNRLKHWVEAGLLQTEGSTKATVYWLSEAVLSNLGGD